MNNKNNVLKFGILILGFIILVIGLILHVINDEDKSLNKDPENIEENKIDGKQVYICQNEIKDLNYTSYQMETVYVVDGIVQKTVPSMKVICNDKEIYNVFKNDKEYSKDKVFNDNNLTITFSNGDEVSLIEDVNGNKTEVEFLSYQKELNKVGYICTQE